MKRAFLLLFVLFMLLPFQTKAQTTDWDAVLDRYEDICGQCISLRDRIVAGESVSDRAVTSLLQELSQLRNTLQNASGSMTGKQKQRFNAIRDSYTGNTVTEPSKNVETQPTAVSQTKTVKPAGSASPKQETIKTSRPDSTYIRIKSIPIVRPQLSDPSINNPDSLKSLDIVVSNDSTSGNEYDQPIEIKRNNTLDTYLLAGYNRTLSIGGMIIVGKDRSKCFYISVLSNFSNTQSDYSCSNDGRIKGGGVFWGDGTVTDNQLFLTAGTAVWNSTSGNISVYAGAGYGINERLWRDITGKWAIVSDKSGRGLILQTTAAFRFKHFAVSPSLIYMPNSHYLLPSLGIGYSF